MSLRRALSEAGGAGAPVSRAAWLRELLVEELRRGAHELAQARSGRVDPVTVAFAGRDGALLAALPIDARLRADPAVAGERAWLLAAATVGALVELADVAPPRSAAELSLTCGALDGFLVLGYPEVHPDPELAVYAFEEQAADLDRLRTAASAVPPGALRGAAETLGRPVGAAHPLRVAEAIARFGGRPASRTDDVVCEDSVLTLLQGARGAARPHEDPDDARRIARRILQRLAGMGKWGGYHTEFAHLARGFAGNEREAAERVGHALLACGLLREKPSVGQRHVYLNPRRAGEIHALIETGEAPPDLALPYI